MKNLRKISQKRFHGEYDKQERHQKFRTELKSTGEETRQMPIACEEGTIRKRSADQMEKPNLEAEPTKFNKIKAGPIRWGQAKMILM